MQRELESFISTDPEPDKQFKKGSDANYKIRMAMESNTTKKTKPPKQQQPQTSKSEDVSSPREMERYLSTMYEKPIALREQDETTIQCPYCGQAHTFEDVGRFVPDCESGQPITLGSRTFTPRYGVIVYEYETLHDGTTNKYEIKNHF